MALKNKLEQHGRLDSTLLSESLKTKHDFFIRFLIEQLPNSQQPNATTGQTPLHQAVQYGLDINQHVLDVEREKPRYFQVLIEQTAINTKDNVGNTPLHVAVLTQQQRHTIGILLEQGADPNIKNDEGNTPLFCLLKRHACLEDREDISACIVLLLKSPIIDLEARNNAGMTALHLACEASNAYYVSLCCEQGSDLKARDNSGKTPLDIACLLRRTPAKDRLIHCLREHEAPSSHYTTAQLHLAIARKDYNRMRTLLNSQSASASLRPLSNEQAPLRQAIIREDLEAVLLLLSHIRPRAAHGRCYDEVQGLLNLAILQGNVAIVDALLQVGVDLFAENDYGATPLSMACHQGTMAIVRTLFNRHDRRQAERVKNEYLALSIRTCRPELVAFFLENQATANERMLDIAVNAYYKAWLAGLLDRSAQAQCVSLILTALFRDQPQEEHRHLRLLATIKALLKYNRKEEKQRYFGFTAKESLEVVEKDFYRIQLPERHEIEFLEQWEKHLESNPASSDHTFIQAARSNRQELLYFLCLEQQAQHYPQEKREIKEAF